MSAMRRRRHSRGQALTELALAAPLLLALLAGSAQVGVIYYDQISLDTAVREGARVAADSPASLGIFSAGSPKTSPGNVYTCTASDTKSACIAIFNSTQNGKFGGLISTGNLLNVTITASTFPGSTPATCLNGTSASTNDGLLAVHVEYQAPVFLPFVSRALSDSGQSYRTVKSNVTVRVDPCSITNGN